MNERQLSEPCSICKHWVGAEEACPDLQNYISNLCGQMCAQGIQRFYRQFCATSVNTRFEWRDGITEEIMKKIPF